MQPQNKGPGMLWGQSYVLPMTWGGGGIWGAPFGRHAALQLFHFNGPQSHFNVTFECSLIHVYIRPHWSLMCATLVKFNK